MRFHCTANRGRSGAHRSTPIIVTDPPERITANLYAVAALPENVLVEVQGLPVLVSARTAYQLGRVLVSLGKAGDAQ